MSLLPEIMQDTHNLALEECIKKELVIDIKPFMIYPIENLPDDKLLYLAKEFHVTGYEGWNLAQTRAQKINLIKNSLVMHSLKGTKKSILNALSSLGIEAEITEIEARPSHFTVKFLNIKDRGLTEEFEKEIMEVINNYKPLTRILDKINYYLMQAAMLYTGARFKTLETVIVSSIEEQI
ncbi:MAG: phage tail protein [Candidatus Gastranaerophilales bacterium]|nr:phage tail protein [Candidatus Gastranaerophilales bacterium]